MVSVVSAAYRKMRYSDEKRRRGGVFTIMIGLVAFLSVLFSGVWHGDRR